MFGLREGITVLQEGYMMDHQGPSPFPAGKNFRHAFPGTWEGMHSRPTIRPAKQYEKNILFG